MNLKEYSIDDKLCVGGWFIPENICDELITFFKTNSHKQISGTTNKAGVGITVDTEIKKSTDITIPIDEDFYPINLYRDALQSCLNEYIKKYSFVNNCERFSITEGYNLQYYKPGDGYIQYHFEKGASEHSKKRLLVFMTYLNDVPDGGTDFLYQKITTPAKKGLTLIWPSDWTHTHKSQISYTQEKYIATGWYSILDNNEDKR